MSLPINGVCLPSKSTKNSVFMVRRKEVYALYSSQNIIGVIKKRRLRSAGYVARMGED